MPQFGQCGKSCGRNKGAGNVKDLCGGGVRVLHCPYWDMKPNRKCKWEGQPDTLWEESGAAYKRGRASATVHI